MRKDFFKFKKMSVSKIVIICLCISVIQQLSFAQYPPQAPLPGNDAIAASDSIIVDWAKNCTVERGWINIADTSLGKANFGNEQNAIGSASSSLVSLGDGGIAVLTFEYAIKNGAGPDFAIFENGFSDPLNDTMAFLELAFVEVSSDGENYFRFPATSQIQDTVQIDNFTYSDARQIHNLAGKYKNGYGTPFDLEELKNEMGLDVNNITHIRIVDVVGSLDSNYAAFDANGKIINDPYPTEFPSSGFDLNAVAVIHDNRPEIPNNINDNTTKTQINIYPNPFYNSIYIASDLENELLYSVTDILGKTLLSGAFTNLININTQHLSQGIYLVKIANTNTVLNFKLVKK